MDRLEEIKMHPRCREYCCQCCDDVPHLLELVDASNKALLKAGIEVGKLLLQVHEVVAAQEQRATRIRELQQQVRELEIQAAALKWELELADEMAAILRG